MPGRSFLHLLPFLFLASCAQPKYETAAGKVSLSGQEVREQKASQCALKFSASGFCLSWKWESEPKGNGEAASLVFKVYRGNLLDDSPVPVDLAPAPVLDLWMPSMGHGSAPTTVARIDQGTYRASEVRFLMPGDWELRFRQKEGDRVLDEAVVSILLP